MIVFLKKETRQGDGDLETSWAIRVPVLLPILSSRVICKCSIGLGDLDELGDCQGVIWVLVWMLYETEVPVCLFDNLHVRAWLDAKNLERIERFQRFYLADLYSSKVPDEPE